MREIDIKDIQVENVCKEGNIIFIDGCRYAVHYNVTLAMKRYDSNTLYINSNYANRFSQSDLKTIRGIDETFKKKGTNFVSEQYDIEVVNFVKDKYETSRVYLAV